MLRRLVLLLAFIVGIASPAFATKTILLTQTGNPTTTFTACQGSNATGSAPSFVCSSAGHILFVNFAPTGNLLVGNCVTETSAQANDCITGSGLTNASACNIAPYSTNCTGTGGTGTYFVTNSVGVASNSNWGSAYGFTLPADWNPTSFSMACYGGGGSGFNESASTIWGGGGASGNYTLNGTFPLTSSGTGTFTANSIYAYQVGIGGGAQSTTNATAFSPVGGNTVGPNNATGCGAAGGSNATSTAGGAGQVASTSTNSNYTTALGGVTGGAGGGVSHAGGGGSGQSGPNGNGVAGAAGGSSINTAGGAGGNADAGFGGVGGTTGGISAPAQAGTNGAEYTATVGGATNGPGGGGQGGASVLTADGAGANGGTGAGGGGGGDNQGAGVGGPGLIVLQYNPASNAHQNMLMGVGELTPSNDNTTVEASNDNENKLTMAGW